MIIVISALCGAIFGFINGRGKYLADKIYTSITFLMLGAFIGAILVAGGNAILGNISTLTTTETVESVELIPINNSYVSVDGEYFINSTSLFCDTTHEYEIYRTHLKKHYLEVYETTYSSSILNFLFPFCRTEYYLYIPFSY